jgi:excisionase family DNA binding protein
MVVAARSRAKRVEELIVMNARFLTEGEVAERTQISLATLRRWRLENRGPKYRKFGSLVRYPEEELARWEETQPGGGDTTERIESKLIGGGRNTRISGKSSRDQGDRKATPKTANGAQTASRSSPDAAA